MKKIEVVTPQNVVLQYELADLKDRILAFLIDVTTLTVALSILSAIGLGIFSYSETAQTVFTILLFCVFIFYSLCFELWNNGQSIGKMALRIQVIKMAGGKASFSDYAARWVFRLIDIYFSLGAIASILVASSAKAQRIGDVVANTAVVKTVPKVDLNLNDLMSIHRHESYTPKYLLARKLHEDDALLIKMTLERYRKFNNTAHEEAVAMLVQRIEKILDVETTEQDQFRFLQTVLQDYVILTR